MKQQKIAGDFKDMVVSYVQKKGQACLFLLLDTLKDLDNKEFIPENLAGDERIKEIKTSITDFALRLEEIFDQGSEAAAAAIAALAEKQGALVLIGQTMNTYDAALKMAYDFLAHFIRKENARQIIDEDAQFISAQLFVDDCMAYIDDEETDFPEHVKKSQLISCFPLRMARQKYNGIVQSSVLRLMDDLSESDTDMVAETLKRRFYPVKSAAYGMGFEALKARIERLFFTDFEAMDAESLEALWVSNEDIKREVDDILYYLDMLLEPMLFLTVLLRYMPSFETVFDDNLVYKDLYFTFKENYHTENFELIVDSFSNTLDEALETVLDECMALEKQIEKQIGRFERTPPDEQTMQFANLFFALNDLYDLSLDKLCYPLGYSAFDNNPPAGEAYYAAACGKVLDFIAQSTADLSNSRQKLIRQLFLGAIPCDMPDEEFASYLRYSFDEIQSDGEKIMVTDAVVKVFENAGFEGWSGDGRDEDDDVDFDDDHEHHHHHDHDCDCGHKH